MAKIATASKASKDIQDIQPHTFLYEKESAVTL